MKASKTWAGERPKAIGHGKPQTGLPLSSEEEMQERYAPWCLEEIEAPEVWTLASFDDLLPHELA